MMDGFILIDKPIDITSFGVISKLRKITGVKRIGHCGTLDPRATGLLICAIGRGATRDINHFLKKDKTYIAEIELGKESDTYDSEGTITNVLVSKIPTLKMINKVLSEFTGEQEQMPPIFSAKKIDGKRAYELARLGKEVVLKPVKIKINKIRKISYSFPNLKIEVDCGSGTYIRSLANDIGGKLGTGAYLKGLRRIKISDQDLKKSISLGKLNQENWEKHLFFIKK